MRVWIPGPPVPKQSFRVGRRGGYADPRVTAYQEHVRYCVGPCLSRDWTPLADMNTTIAFYLSDRRRRDLDNLSKCILDALKGLVYADDCQVNRITIEKHFSKEPGVMLGVTSGPFRSEWLPKEGKCRKSKSANSRT